MNINDFKAGRLEKQDQYQSFMPNLVNQEWQLSDPGTLTLLSDADHVLGKLNAFSQLVPNADFFMWMHIVKEATTSNRIEGIQIDVQEALLDEKNITPVN